MPIVSVQGKNIQFPDSMGQDEIRAVLQKKFPPAGESVVAPVTDSVEAPQEQGVLDQAARFAEPALTVASSAIAEPIAGLAGVAQAINPFAEEGAGAEAVQATREALTFQPRTEAGQEGLQAVSEALQPVGEAFSEAEKFLGDSVFEATDSPALASAAASLPTAILEIIGVKGGGRIGKAAKAVEPSASAIKRNIQKAAPSAEQLKNMSRQLYKELDDAGVQLNSSAYDKLVLNSQKAAKKQGLSARTTPRAMGLIDDLKEIQGGNIPLAEVQDLRKVAQGVSKTIDPTEAAIGARVLNELDVFLDNLTPAQLTEGSIPAAKIGKKARAARKLWGSAKRSELITDTIERAKNRASGFENGLRIEFDKIAKNKKVNKFFTTEELNAINDLVKGDVPQNIAKLFGKFGTLGGRDANALGALGAGGLGSATGGLPGFLTAVSVGSASRKIAETLTKNKANFINAVARAGDNGQEITKAYLKVVPKNKRSIKELSFLLSDPKVDVSKLLASSDRLIKQAGEIALGRQMIGQAAGAMAAGATTTQESK